MPNPDHVGAKTRLWQCKHQIRLQYVSYKPRVQKCQPPDYSMLVTNPEYSSANPQITAVPTPRLQYVSYKPRLQQCQPPDYSMSVTNPEYSSANPQITLGQLQTQITVCQLQTQITAVPTPDYSMSVTNPDYISAHPKIMAMTIIPCRNRLTPRIFLA